MRVEGGLADMRPASHAGGAEGRAGRVGCSGAGVLWKQAQTAIACQHLRRK